jgi:hypothetical protein
VPPTASDPGGIRDEAGRPSLPPPSRLPSRAVSRALRFSFPPARIGPRPRAGNLSGRLPTMVRLETSAPPKGGTERAGSRGEGRRPRPPTSSPDRRSFTPIVRAGNGAEMRGAPENLPAPPN